MSDADFCPYVGLRPFTAAERAYFFGRERDQRIIAANLFASPLTVLYGPSAVGKSSVLQAGVVPQLAVEAHTAVVYFATWQDPTYIDRLRGECRRAVAAAQGSEIDADPSLPLDEWLVRASARFRGTLLVVLDQFEEYLLYHSETGGSSFDEELARIVNRRDVAANVLVGIREDGLAKLDRFRKRIPNLLGNTLRLRRLTPDAARQAIRGPLDVYNKQRGDGVPPVRIEDDLVEAVVAQVRATRIQSSAAGSGTTGTSDEGELIETALLQMVMTHLWRHASVVDGTRVMTKPSLDALGGARNVVKRHLYERIDELDADGKTIAANLFQELVTPSGAKIAHTTEDLIAFAKRPADRVVPVLEHLARARLLRRVDPPERYEIFHDALAPAILDWRGEYLRQAALEEAERKRKEAARLRNRRAALVGAAILGAISVAVGIYYFREAEHLRLTLNLTQEQASKAGQLQEAAKQAQDAAEQRRTEAELTLRRGEIEVESMKARLAGQLERAAQLQAEAKTVDAGIARARTASTASSRQAQTQLEAAAETQKRIDALNSAIEQKGFATPNTNASTTPPDGTAVAPTPPKPVVETPVVTEEPKKPAVAETPPPQPKGDYAAIYRQAINARDRKQWPQAVQLFQTAAAIKPDTGETVAMPGFGKDERYLPYFNLGVALQGTKDCAGALDAWSRAEQLGAVQKSGRDYDTLKRRRAECGGK